MPEVKTLSDATRDVNLYDLRDTLTAAAALGLPVPAPALTRAVQVTLRGVEYDDPDVILGVYQSRESAYIALRNWVLARHDENGDFVPWADDIADHTTAAEYDNAWNLARTAWLNGKTDEEVIDTMLPLSEYYFTDICIEPDPERAM